MVTRTMLTLDEFLELPETKPASEYVDGEVMQKMAPSMYYSRLTARLIAWITIYLDQTSEAYLHNELRHATTAAGERAYIPDISIIRRQTSPRGRQERRRGPVWSPPDFAIEVLSPGDYPGRVLERADFFMRVGTDLLWFVDPELETVTVYRPGIAPVVHRAPETIDALPVLAAFSLDLAALFAFLHVDEDEDDDAASDEDS